MTIQEAIKIGKDFHLRSHRGYFSVDEKGKITAHVYISNNQGYYSTPAQFTKYELLSNRWECISI